MLHAVKINNKNRSEFAAVSKMITALGYHLYGVYFLLYFFYYNMAIVGLN